MATLPALLLTGCVTDDKDIYDAVNEAAWDEMVLGENKVDIFTPETWLMFVDKLKWWVPYIILISWAVCGVLLLIFKKVKKVQKKAFLLFGVAIPGIAFLAVNIVSYMYGHFW